MPGEADRVDREQMGAQGLEARVTGRRRREGGTDSRCRGFQGSQLDSQLGVDAAGASPSAQGLEAPEAAALGEQAPAAVSPPRPL